MQRLTIATVRDSLDALNSMLDTRGASFRYRIFSANNTHSLQRHAVGDSGGSDVSSARGLREVHASIRGVIDALEQLSK